MPRDIHQRYLTVDEIAEYLGFNRQTLWRWAREEVIPHYRVGNKFRFKLDEVERWMQRRKKKCRAA